MDETQIPAASHAIHDSLPEGLRAHIASINAGEAPAGRGHYVVDELHALGRAHSMRALDGLLEQRPGFLVAHPVTGRLGWHTGAPDPLPSSQDTLSHLHYGPGGDRAEVHSHGGGSYHFVLPDPADFVDHHRAVQNVVNHDPSTFGFSYHPDRPYLRTGLTLDEADRVAHLAAWHEHLNDHHERLARDTSHDVEPRLTEMKKIKPPAAAKSKPLPRRSTAKAIADLAGVKPSKAATAVRKAAGVTPSRLSPGELPPANDLSTAHNPASWLAGTRLEHHLTELTRHEHGAVAEAARAVLTQSDGKAAARLGALLKGLGHRLADAYNWGTMQRNIDGDRALHAHLTQAGLSRGISAETFARNIEARGQSHSALDALAKVHGTHRDEVLRAVKRISDRYADKRALADLRDYGGDSHDYDSYMGMLSADDHARLSKLGTLAHGVAAGLTAAAGHYLGKASGYENAEMPGAALGFYGGLATIGHVAREATDRLLAHVARRRAQAKGKLSPRIEALVQKVQEKPAPDVDATPVPASSRASFIRALAEGGYSPHLYHTDPDLQRVWHLNAGRLNIHGPSALDVAARRTGLAHLRAHGYLPIPESQAALKPQLHATAPPGKPPGEYRRVTPKPAPKSGDLFAAFDAGPPPPRTGKPKRTRAKPKRPPGGPTLFDQV